MGTIVKIVEESDVELFKNKMESELNQLHADKIATDVKFSVALDHRDYAVYTAMIIGST